MYTLVDKDYFMTTFNTVDSIMKFLNEEMGDDVYPEWFADVKIYKIEMNSQSILIMNSMKENRNKLFGPPEFYDIEMIHVSKKIWDLYGRAVSKTYLAYV